MALRDEIQADTVPRAACSLARISSQLDPKTRSELNEILADVGVLGSTIARVLNDRGHHVKAQTVQRHRRGECSCS